MGPHGVVGLYSEAQQCTETGQGIHFVPVLEFQMAYFSVKCDTKTKIYNSCASLRMSNKSPVRAFTHALICVCDELVSLVSLGLLGLCYSFFYLVPIP